MRDPNRIQKYCNKLADLWRCVPDWRFGQLMYNVLSDYVAATKRDIFFVEDDVFFKFLNKYIKEHSPYGGAD